VRPVLWDCYSDGQVFLTALSRTAPGNRPAVSFTGLIADQDHFKGSFGGRVFPLWRDAKAAISNTKPALLAYLAATYSRSVGGEDVLAYVAAVLAHPAFTARFASDLIRPGLRVPITRDVVLFEEAVALGREVIWLHCYGERFASGRPSGPPRLPKGLSPKIPAHGSIPVAPEPLPNTIEYDPVERRLTIGKGSIDNVPKAVWDYEVSGKNILRQWFSYRKRDRTRPVIGDRRPPSPLDGIQPNFWLAEYTSDLIDLLHVLGRLVLLEPKQADLLDRICSGPILIKDALIAAGALAMPKVTKIGPKKKTDGQDDLFVD
jgi:Type ISP C-terminal specificity domain